jgi:hypothetical protein
VEPVVYRVTIGVQQPLRTALLMTAKRKLLFVQRRKNKQNVEQEKHRRKPNA